MADSRHATFKPMAIPRAVAGMFCVGFTGTKVSPEMRELIARGVGGAILFKRNVQSAQQVSDLCAELKTLAGRPFITCIEQEGGRVMRLGPPFTQSPSMRIVGQTGDVELAHQLGQIAGREQRAV